MKVLQVHNFYQQAGGEDQVFEAEAELLRSHGNEVIRYTKHNDSIDETSRIKLAASTIYNQETFSELRKLIQNERPDVMHCTNIFPLISPAAYDAAQAENVPVVQSLHNYRLICPGANLICEQSACEKCVGTRTFWPSVVNRCYRGSRLATAVTAAMLVTHRARGTWTEKVNRYIALSDFSKSKLVAGGLPEKNIAIKPNFLSHDPDKGTHNGGNVIFVGRLSAEKGIETLLAAWRQMREDIPLQIIGDGPLAESVREAAAASQNIEWLGRRSHDEVLDRIGAARLLIFPSTCYETFGLTLIEAFAKGTPVVASAQGAAAELVTENTGVLFQPGDPTDLATKVCRLWNCPDLDSMCRAARTEFMTNYTADVNYDQLLSIYEEAISCSQTVGAQSPVLLEL